MTTTCPPASPSNGSLANDFRSWPGSAGLRPRRGSQRLRLHLGGGLQVAGRDFGPGEDHNINGPSEYYVYGGKQRRDFGPGEDHNKLGKPVLAYVGTESRHAAPAPAPGRQEFTACES